MQRSLFFIALILLFVSSCGKKESNAIEGSLSLNGDGDEVVSNPDAVVSTYEISHNDLSNIEINNLTLPYVENLFPVAMANEYVVHAKCSSQYEEKCIVNRQVLFKFDLAAFKSVYPSNKWSIKDISLQISLYSPYDANPKEKICFLNTGKCSGNVIVPVVDDLDDILFNYIANDAFWNDGVASVVLNDSFKNFLTATYDQGNNTWIAEKVNLPISSLLNFSQQTFNLIQQQYDTLFFLVADDVYVENPKLQIIVEKL